MQIIYKYFPQLDQKQYKQFEKLGACYREWNDNINVISRRDIDRLYERHVLHSLSIACFMNFSPQSRLLDLGTGGGFPGIPLAILFPDCQFILLDSVLKKLRVAEDICRQINLQNIRIINKRAESVKEKFDFVLSRAVTDLKTLFQWSSPLISSVRKNVIPNGLIALKGGNLDDEINRLGKAVQLIPISSYFEEYFFKEKYIVYVPVK